MTATNLCSIFFFPGFSRCRLHCCLLRAIIQNILCIALDEQLTSLSSGLFKAPLSYLCHKLGSAIFLSDPCVFGYICLGKKP